MNLEKFISLVKAVMGNFPLIKGMAYVVLTFFNPLNKNIIVFKQYIQNIVE
jgi:hypothetical protein